MRGRPSIVVALVALTGPAWLDAQLPVPFSNAGPGQSSSQSDTGAVEPPVFRSAVTLVHMDVQVTDSEGNPVTGLTEEDFEVREDGSPRAITTFSAVHLPPDSLAAPGDAVESDMRTNEHPPGRTYLIALDEVSPDRVLRARNIARQFITEHLGPYDVAAVAFSGRSLSSSGQDFTGNRRLLIEAVDRFSGGFDRSTPNNEDSPAVADDTTLRGIDRAFSSEPRQLASGLRTLTEFLATLPGRKTLLFVAEGLGEIDFFSVVDYNGGALTPAAFDAHAAIAAATRGNVTIYPIDPRGLTTDLTPPADLIDSNGTADLIAKTTAILNNRTDLGALAEITGGFAFSSSNAVGPAFERIVRENSSYYTLGFNSEYPRRDGRFVSVDVRTKRPDLQVRARSGYVAPLGEERRPAQVQGSTRLASVSGALTSPTAVRGVPMRVVAAPYRAQRDRASIALAIELDTTALEYETRNAALASDIEVSYFAIDSRGRTQPGRRHAATLSFARTVAFDVIRQGVRVLSEFELAPGRYQLRVAAGSGNTAGSVVYDLEVPDFDRETLSMSGIALTSAAFGGARTLRPHDPLGDVLPGPPTAAREFPRDDALSAFVEVYDNRRRGAASSPIELRAMLTNPDGSPVSIIEETRPSTAQRRRSGGHGFSVNLPLHRVPPGAYFIRVEARAQGTERTVSRTIPIRIR